LVLHWLTSKDNASTTLSAPVRSGRLSGYVPVLPPTTELHAHPHPRASHRKVGNVTTLVTAGKTDLRNGEDLDGELEYPPNAITVSREMVRAVDKLSSIDDADKEQGDKQVDSESEMEGEMSGVRRKRSRQGLYNNF